MGLFTRQKTAKIEFRNTLVNAEWWQQFTSLFSKTSSNVHVNQNNAIGIAAYRRGVELRSASIAAMTLKLYASREGKKVEVTDDPSLRVLRKPNAYQTEYQFRQYMGAGAVGKGNNYAWIRRDGSGNPIELKPCTKPESVIITETTSGDIFYTFTEINFPQNAIPSTDVLHFKGLAWKNPYYGISPIESHRERLGVIIAAEKASATTYKTGAKKFAVSSDSNINAAQQLLLKESLENVMNDTAISAVLPAGGRIEELSLSPADADYINAANLGVQEIGRILGIPNSFLNIDAGGKTTEDEWNGFVSNTLLPDATNYEQEMTNKLLKETQIGTFFFKHSFNYLMRANSSARSEYYTKAISAGWMSPNDVAMLEDMQPVEGGDVRMTLSNLIPIEQMGKWIDSKIVANESKTINNPDGNN